MKQIICSLMALAIIQFSLAQGTDTVRVFKKFKVDVSLGYAIPLSSSVSSGGSGGYNGGAIFAVEPKYAFADAFALGLRIEAAALVHEYTNNYSQTVKGKANVSYLLTGDYYFSNKSFRPFLGAGLGVFTIANVDSSTVNSNSNTIPTTSQFGGLLRVGFEAGHFRLGVEYNIVGSGASYLGLKVGVCIGGGRIKHGD
jgi:outer membrane protein X